MKDKILWIILIFLLLALIFLNIIIPNFNEVRYRVCLATTRNPDKVTDDHFMVQYDTTLSEEEIADHILKMGFNYSSIKITNDYYLIAMDNTKIKEENPPTNISKATAAEFDKFSEYLLDHSSLITLAIRNPKGIMAMKVEFQGDIPEEISRLILDELVLEYGNDEVWDNAHQYYFQERYSVANIRISEGSGITEVEGYCKFLMEDGVIGAELIGDRVYALN